jgi:hypothetical protein
MVSSQKEQQGLYSIIEVVKMSKRITKTFFIQIPLKIKYKHIVQKNPPNLRKTAKSSIYYSKSLRLKEYGIRGKTGGKL